MMSRFFLLLLSCLLAQTTFAGDTPHVDKKLDSLLVYGQGFIFSVKEPAGWKGDTVNAAQFSTNIIFYPASQSLDKAQTIIRVLVADKTDENINEDLAHDMTGYREQYPNVVFKELAISHPKYQVFPKLFTVPGSFYEYVAYVNPGPTKKLMFSVSMNKQMKEASELELDVFQNIIASLQML
jgi:hypothetical protein